MTIIRILNDSNTHRQQTVPCIMEWISVMITIIAIQHSTQEVCVKWKLLYSRPSFTDTNNKWRYLLKFLTRNLSTILLQIKITASSSPTTTTTTTTTATTTTTTTITISATCCQHRNQWFHPRSWHDCIHDRVILCKDGPCDNPSTVPNPTKCWPV